MKIDWNRKVEGGFFCPVMPFKVWLISTVLACLGVILLIALFTVIIFKGFS